MKYFIVLSILLSGPVAQAQKITQLSPPNITFRAAGIADTNNAILAGDSATIFWFQIVNGSLSNLQTVPPPFSRTHTFYGLSYYSSDSAIFVADNGLIFTWAAGKWQRRGTGLTTQILRGITHTADGGFVIVGDSGIVLRSTNVGVTWQKIPSSTVENIYAIAVNDSGNGYFVGAHGLIGRTSDYGKSWLDVSDTTNLSQYSESPVALRAITISGDSAIAAGDSSAAGMIRSGSPWTRIPIANYAPIPSAAIAFTAVGYDPFRRWVFFSDQDVEGILYGWGDSIINSDNARNGDPDGGSQDLIYRYNCIASLAPFPFYIQGGPFESSEDFVSSTLYLDYYNVENFLFASFDLTSKIGYATALDGIFLRTTNGGNTWNTVGIYGPGWIGVSTNYDPTDIFTIDANHAFAVGWAGTMFRTSDGGVTWDSTTIAPNDERLHSIANPSDSTYIVCGDGGTIIRSTDGATTWQPENTPTTAYLEWTSFSSADTGVAVGSNGDIIRTTDQGITWQEVNNLLTGTNIAYRQVQGFPSGIYYATSDSAGLFRSTDHGENWSAVPDVPQTMSEGFYNDHIGVIAESAWSSAVVDDTMRFAFTRDGFATKPTQWTMPIVSNNRMVFHFLDSNTFLCFGSDGFVVKVDMSQSGARVTTLSAVPNSTIRVYPNPTTGEIRIEYTTTSSGPVRIQLFSEDGKDMGTLFSGTEPPGSHQQLLTLPQNVTGTFFIRLIADGTSSTTKLTLQ